MRNTTTSSKMSTRKKARIIPGRTRVIPRKKATSKRKRRTGLVDRLNRAKERKSMKKVSRSYPAIKRETLRLLKKDDVEHIARETGFVRRTAREIEAFDFVLCSIMAAMIEGKRGFATIWRLLTAAVGVKVARSAVTQRFGVGSARMMEELFSRVVAQIPQFQCPEMLDKLEQFRAVLANDGTVITLSPVLKKMFPSTRTNSVDAAGKLHVTAEVARRQIVCVKFTGERDSELKVVREQGIISGVLYLGDLGYYCYDYFGEIIAGNADLTFRMKENANPTITKIRRGIRRPKFVVQGGLKFQDPQVQYTQCDSVFDLDAEFPTKSGPITLRVVGCYNREAGKYHCYLTTLRPEDFTPEEIATIYSRRWELELIFKLLKSACHLDHVDTSDPEALRTHIYASLLGAVILTALCKAASDVYEIPISELSTLVIGIAAPMIALPLLYLWCKRKLTREELADSIMRVIAFGCADQNRNRTRKKWNKLQS